MSDCQKKKKNQFARAEADQKNTLSFFSSHRVDDLVMLCKRRKQNPTISRHTKGMGK